MTGTMIRQTMFTTGEVDEDNFKRSDMPDIYMTSAQSLLNCEVGTTGLVRKRKGSQSLVDATSFAEVSTRLFDFVDKNGLHYIVIASPFLFVILYSSTENQVLINHENKYVINHEGKQVVVNFVVDTVIQKVPHSYTGSDLGLLDYTQDSDSIIFSHPRFAPARLYVKEYVSIYPTFDFLPLNIKPHYPTYDFNKVNYNDIKVDFQEPDASKFKITMTGTAGVAIGFNEEWIDGIVIGLGTSETSPLGYGRITSFEHSDDYSVISFVGITIVPFAPVNQMPKIGSQYSIRQPAWSDKLGWPEKVLYYQNRLFFASTAYLPDTIFGSKINSPTNFDVGIGRDNEAIVYTIGQSDAGSIVWLNGAKQLEVFTENFEFACPQDENSGLTPSSFSIRQQSSYGSSKSFKPLTYANNSYYISKTGKSFNAFNFTGVGLAYQSHNVSVASQHLIKNPFNRAIIRGSSQSQDNFIYLLNDDNTISIFQFALEMKFAAFTPMKFQEDVRVIDIVNSNNRLYFLKYYRKTQKYFLEKMVDDVKLDSYKISSMSDVGLISNLNEYAGYKLQVIYKNQDLGEYTVSQTGTIQILNPTGIADTIFVGFLYDVEIVPMYIFGGQTNAQFKKMINQIYVDYSKSLNFNINGRLVPYQNIKDIQKGLNLVPKTDTVIVDVVQGYERFDTIKISQRSPFDLNILSIGYMVKTVVI